MYTNNAGVSCPVVVVGNHWRNKSRPRNTRRYLLRAFTTRLTLQSEISYVSTRSEQIANAILSMSHGHKALQGTNIAIFLYIITTGLFFARHKNNNLPSKGKLSFNVFL